jgi:hypothetical protein
VCLLGFGVHAVAVPIPCWSHNFASNFLKPIELANPSEIPSQLSDVDLRARRCRASDPLSILRTCVRCATSASSSPSVNDALLTGFPSTWRNYQASMSLKSSRPYQRDTDMNIRVAKWDALQAISVSMDLKTTKASTYLLGF